ncbi:hypothetical protein K437DRAFT_41763 [Tilletiaria anomala UBC 951]|uniref:Uncharacterized protein n=1 Tax=Tilletiaria anomala (strain ATCC 24038 / CBS 436.72 / UBC 951) TaxID=1037660 RepID=A0A066VET7_TILAU|nr:uncharacterized protein K437DRAFT_41763 [Tilletiaria anomala UBC 951]KDN37269.1 hypothetical protein K437DRAFT_41763 [Tilletiaria anomala UBC 951]
MGTPEALQMLSCAIGPLLSSDTSRRLGFGLTDDSHNAERIKEVQYNLLPYMSNTERVRHGINRPSSSWLLPMELNFVQRVDVQFVGRDADGADRHIAPS